MSTKIRQHIRSNVVGYIALFAFALAGTAIAVDKAPRNSVVSSSIKNGQVKLNDLRANSVDASKVVDDSLTGADIQESSLQGMTGPQGPTGPPGADGSPDTPAQVLAKLMTVDGAGSGLDADVLDGTSSAGFIQSGQVPTSGDLTGSYPNPTLANGSVSGGTGGEIADNTVTGADVNEATLAGVNAATVGGGQVCRTNGVLTITATTANSSTEADVCSFSGVEVTVICNVNDLIPGVINGDESANSQVIVDPVAAVGNFVSLHSQVQNFTDANYNTSSGVGLEVAEDSTVNATAEAAPVTSFAFGAGDGSQVTGQSFNRTKLTSDGSDVTGTCDFVVGAMG